MLVPHTDFVPTASAAPLPMRLLTQVHLRGEGGAGVGWEGTAVGSLYLQTRCPATPLSASVGVSLSRREVQGGPLFTCFVFGMQV